MQYSRTPLIRPPSESHWCGRIRGMVAREGFVYEQKPLSVTRNVVIWEGWSLVRVVVRQGFYCTGNNNNFSKPTFNFFKWTNLLWLCSVWRIAGVKRVDRRRMKEAKKQECCRKWGRPQLRWEDCVKKDLRKTEDEEKWKETANNRDQWKNNESSHTAERQLTSLSALQQGNRRKKNCF